MKMRYLPLALSLMFGPVIAANAQVSVAIGLPDANIGINMSMYPQLVQVPDYPVYYDPQASANYFFYDGAYWVYQRDNWYASTWYNGPWQEVGSEDVPLFVLRIPVRYYREPPAYFSGWNADSAPRWGDHWGQSWSSQHEGWDQWNRNSVPAAAPLPTYQRQYFGGRYPRTVMQQTSIRTQDYRYQPREAVTRQIQQHGSSSSPAVAHEQAARARQEANAQHARAQQTQQRGQTQQTKQRVQAQHTEQRAQAQQTKQRAQAQHSEQRAQVQQTKQRAQAQHTEQRAQVQQTEQRTQVRQTKQRAQAQQTEQRAQVRQTKQRAQTQQTQQRAQAHQTQTQQRSQTQQRAQAQQTNRSKPQNTKPTKAVPKNKDKKAQDQGPGHGGG